MGYFNRVTASLHILQTANQETEGSKIGLQYKIRKGGNKFGADFRIPEIQMELNEIA